MSKPVKVKLARKREVYAREKRRASPRARCPTSANGPRCNANAWGYNPYVMFYASVSGRHEGNGARESETANARRVVTERECPGRIGGNGGV